MAAEITSQLCQSFVVFPVNHIHELTKDTASGTALYIYIFFSLKKCLFSEIS
jgi:hypothetical protein